MTFEILHRRFEDQFDEYAAGGDGSPNWENTGGTWQVISEEFDCQADANERCYRVGLIVDDCRIEYKIKRVYGWNMRFFFRGEVDNEHQNNYEVRLTTTAMYLYKYVAGSPTTLGSYTASFSSDTWYTIKIHCKDNNEGNTRIQVYLDGTLRIDETDSSSPHTSGRIGIIARAVDQHHVVDNVDVWGIERSVLSFLVRKSITHRIQWFSCILDNVDGFRTGRYASVDDIEIWRGTTLVKIFSGFIENFDAGSEEGLVINLSGRDYSALMQYVSCYETYTSQEIANIYKDLLTKYAPSLTQTHIQSTGINLAPVYRKRRLNSIAWELAAISNHETWVDGTKDVWLVPPAYTDSGKTFAIGDNIFDYRILQQTTKTVNRVTVFGKTGIMVEVADYELQKQMGFWKDDEIVDPAIDTAFEAKKRGEALLARHRDPRVIEVDSFLNEDLDVGELITLQIPAENIDGKFLVLGIDFQYPEFPTTKLTVAEFRTGVEAILSRLKEDVATLLREQMDLAATLERWVSLTEGPTLDDTKITISRKMISDSFILGHSTYGVLGTSGYGLGDRSGAWVVLQEVENP